ncbi:hypothetical protein [Alteromonas macleodii]|jgi:hypothetical protein|uniref:hypothetical protein n=1 Tax=Alteromonas macleodii TaxID=28108 RepID=UPI0024A9F958|nr:hypothetical protein [Alteromonas macleodii]|tara:strand:- start:377 stop:607 length:231 start_codon:yes stop_codon:yes gene_type:complete
MNETDLKALSAANNRLPHNAYFAYEGTEVIEFNFLFSVGIELLNGRKLKASAIQSCAFSLRFDDATECRLNELEFV